MQLKRFFIIATVIFSAGYTGCGDDGGGGGNGKPRGPKVPQIQKLATRSLGQVSGGSAYTCAVTITGKVLCWGSGNHGKMGNGSDSDLRHPDSSKPVLDGNGDALTDIVQVGLGDHHACAVTTVGKVWCWGKAQYGRLGNDCDSNCTDKNQAVAVVDGDGGTDPLTGIIQVTAGNRHTCALTDAKKVLCWGSGANGQLGNGETVNEKNHPVGVVSSGDADAPLLGGIVQISAGDFHTCALTVEGTVKCWGEGTSGRLGDDTNTAKNHPADVVALTGSTAPLADIVQVSSGGAHTCALTSGGSVKCWGYGGRGNLGYGGTDDKNHPVDVAVSSDDNAPLLTGIVQISTGASFSCALTQAGGVKCWGYGELRSLGNDDTTSANHPVDVVKESGSPFSLSGIIQIASGYYHSCGLTIAGEIKCWGPGSVGQLGNNATDNHAAPVAVVSDTSGTHFHAGLWRREYHCYSDDTCEIDPDSLIRPVLTGARSGASQTPEVEVLGLEEGESVTLHTDAKCLTGSIGTGTVATGETSVTIRPDTGFVVRESTIYAKVGEFCSLSGADYTYTNGAVRIVGDALSTDRTPTLTVARTLNDDELSLHSNSDCSDDALASGTATTTTHDLTLSSLAPGNHTFYLKQNEICHPRGFDYRLAASIRKPSRVSGGNQHTCALTSTGGVKCWGNNDSRSLGNKGTADTDAPVDVKISDGTALTGIVQVDTGSHHACAVTGEGGVMCWGEGDNGRLGNDATTDKDHAVNVVAVGGGGTLSDIVQVSAGARHTCALTSGGGVVCWGSGIVGRLGNDCNSTCNDSDHPLAVMSGNDSTTALTGIVQVSTGSDHTCALTSEGGVVCWGQGTSGRLGNRANASKDAPVNVFASSTGSTLLSNIIQVSAGFEHTCAVTSEGNVKCWGKGDNGRLGNNATTGNQTSPVNVHTASGNSAALSGIIQVDTGEEFTCALASGGGVKCWGKGVNGRLGNDCGSTCPDTATPVAVVDADSGSGTLAGIAGIGVGYDHTCAVTTGDNIKCWGVGTYGRLGNDGTAHKDAPDDVHTADGNGTALDLGASTSRIVCGDVRCAWVTE